MRPKSWSLRPTAALDAGSSSIWPNDNIAMLAPPFIITEDRNRRAELLAFAPHYVNFSSTPENHVYVD